MILEFSQASEVLLALKNQREKVRPRREFVGDCILQAY